MAQDAAAPAPAAPPAAADAAPGGETGPVQRVETKTLWTLFKLGGWSMWPLALCSVAAIGLAIYNGINLRAAKFLRRDLFTQIRDSVRRLDIAQAKTLCESQPAPISNITHAGLDRIEDGREVDLESVEKGMEEAAVEEVASHLVPINYLSVIAVIAPMIGLLGTVSGMIKAFSNMATLGMGRPERLADNISEALVTTASGLIVGIPVMVVYFFFKNRYTGHIATINRMSGELLEILKKSLRSYSAHPEEHPHAFEEHPHAAEETITPSQG